MAQDEERLVVKAAYDFQLALMGNGALTEESFKKTQERAREAFNDFINLIQPWAAKSTEELKKQSIDNLIEMYKETFGDPDDPEFIRKIEEGVAESRRRRRNRQISESDDERVNRMLRERDEAARGLRTR